MNILKDYPGTAQHQSMLRAIVSHYENDPRILAITIFGSLGRGNWDGYSDIDLDVVITDGTKIDVISELNKLSASLESVNQQVAFMIPEGKDACDLVFKSLMEMSIRYHPLSNTSPNIIDSLQLILGRIDRKAIESAGLANKELDGEPMVRILDRCIRHAIGVDSALHRKQIWAAVELLHLMRGSLMELFTRSHHGIRAYQFFQKEAEERLQIRLGDTLPQYDLKSAREAFTKILDLLTNDLERLTDGKVNISKAHSQVLNGIRAR
ncbi:MAG: nucleotidyltransferase domain-containing protein [Anaerolineales bacterium]